MTTASTPPTQAPPAQAPPAHILTSPKWIDFEILDSGDGWKFERCGPYSFVRPEPQALWSPARAVDTWDPDARFAGDDEEGQGRWHFHRRLPEAWTVRYDGLSFRARPTPFRHFGFFPEQAALWDRLGSAVAGRGAPTRILNLFGYSGIASLICARAGAEIVHVDSSRKAIAFGKENAEIAGLADRKLRWICDDAGKFVAREIRRGRHYDGIILDPPKFGRGPKGEVWKIFEALPALLNDCARLLSTRPLFVALTSYAIRASYLSLHYALGAALADRAGSQESGQLGLAETASGRVLAAANFSLWRPE